MAKRLTTADVGQDAKRRKTANLGQDLGALTAVVTALSLGTNSLWSQVQSIVLGEIAQYVQPVVFGARATVLSRLRGIAPAGVCALDGEMYLVEGSNRRVVAYREGVWQRHIGHGEVPAGCRGFAVTNDAVFVPDMDKNCVCVFPRAGGGLLRSFGDRGDGASYLNRPSAVAAWRGSVYVAHFEVARISRFTVDGEYVCHTGPDVAAHPLVTAADGLVLAGSLQGADVFVLHADDLSIVRRIDNGSKPCNGLCAAEGLVFATRFHEDRVDVYDATGGRKVASLSVRRPSGITAGADGTLFIMSNSAFTFIYDVVSVCLL